MIVTGELIGAPEALADGIIDEIVGRRSWTAGGRSHSRARRGGGGAAV